MASEANPATPTPSITLRVYAHVISNQLAEAADIFARIMEAAG